MALFLVPIIFSGCEKPEEPQKPGTASQRYETVPYIKSAKSGELENLVFYDCDEEYNYYFFVLGYVRSVPLAYRPAVYYNGTADFTLTYSMSNLTQQTVSTSVTKASEHSVTNTHSIEYSNEIGGKAEIGPQWLKFEASYKHSWGGSDGTSETNSRSFSNTYETSSSTASQSTDELSENLKNGGRPAGMYRWSLFTTTDVYFVVITDRAKTVIIDAFTTFCARLPQYWRLDYDPEEGGSFGKTATGTLLEIPEIILSQLPDPSEQPALPILTTNAVTTIGTTTAILGGNIINAGIPRYTERGVVYSIMPNPTIADNKTVIAGSGTGDFSTNITSLTEGTTYYVRAYAANTEGVAYGEQVRFTTSEEPRIAYIDANGVTQTRLLTTVTPIASTTTQMSGGWYYVSDNVTVGSRILVSGNVHIILKNGCNFIVSEGINVSTGNSLTIYSQSIGSNMGKLDATGSHGGNGGSGTSGGRGGDAAIGGNGGNGAPNNSSNGSNGSDAGTIIINGGEVTARGGDGGRGGSSWGYGGGGAGASIGGGGGGGGRSSAGLGSNGGAGRSGGSGNDITINGGTVIAWWGNPGDRGTNGGGGGGGAGAGIGGGSGGGGGTGYRASGGGVGNVGNVGDKIGSGGKGGRGFGAGNLLETAGGAGGDGGIGTCTINNNKIEEDGSHYVKIIVTY